MEIIFNLNLSNGWSAEVRRGLARTQFVPSVSNVFDPIRHFYEFDLENNTEARLAAHHPVIGGLDFFERKNLVHRGDAVALTEQKRVFRVRSQCPHTSPAPKRVSREGPEN